MGRKLETALAWSDRIAVVLYSFTSILESLRDIEEGRSWRQSDESPKAPEGK